MTLRPTHNLDSSLTARPIVLIGLMASGKTTVGRLVAGRLGLPFADNDELLFRRTGRPARDIAEHEGAAALHDLEAEALVTAVAEGTPAVVGAAAGAVLEPSAAAALDRCFVVYLRADPAVLADRIAHEPDDGHRPRFDLGAQYRDRDQAYRRLADVVVDAAAAPDAVCNEVIAALATPPPAALPGG